MSETLPPDEARELAWSAVNHAYLYAAAVRAAAQRIVAVLPGETFPHSGDWDAANTARSEGRLIDAMMLVLALRNVLRAGEMAAKYLDGDAGEYVTGALARFREQLPGIVTGRDALEHFDEYVAGEGRRDVPYGLSGTWNGSDFILTGGGASVSVRAANEAVSMLAAGLISVMEMDGR